MDRADLDDHLSCPGSLRWSEHSKWQLLSFFVMTAKSACCLKFTDVFREASRDNLNRGDRNNPFSGLGLEFERVLMEIGPAHLRLLASAAWWFKLTWQSQPVLPIVSIPLQCSNDYGIYGTLFEFICFPWSFVPSQLKPLDLLHKLQPWLCLLHSISISSLVDRRIIALNERAGGDNSTGAFSFLAVQ